jgi:hypothetical protein
MPAVGLIPQGAIVRSLAGEVPRLTGPQLYDRILSLEVENNQLRQENKELRQFKADVHSLIARKALEMAARV